MLEADPYIRIPGTPTNKHPDGRYRMSECVEDPAALSNLNDSVIYLIETSTSPELEKAREILRRLHRREFVSSVDSLSLHAIYILIYFAVMMPV